MSNDLKPGHILKNKNTEKRVGLYINDIDDKHIIVLRFKMEYIEYLIK